MATIEGMRVIAKDGTDLNAGTPCEGWDDLRSWISELVRDQELPGDEADELLHKIRFETDEVDGEDSWPDW